MGGNVLNWNCASICHSQGMPGKRGNVRESPLQKEKPETVREHDESVKEKFSDHLRVLSFNGFYVSNYKFYL